MTPESSSTLLNRVETFVTDNKKTIIVGAAAAIAVGSAGYYLYSTRKSAPATPDIEKAEPKKKKSSKSSKKKRKDKDRADGPILEERELPKVPAAEVDDAESPKLTPAEIEALPREERLTRANGLKNKGNTAYTSRNFTQAVEFYTRAIEMSPSPEAVYFSNRAACYTNYQPPQHELVIRDTDEALKRDPQYVKALNRRANALEALDRLDEALRDFTAATIFDRFQNEAAGASLERVLKKLAQKEAHETITNREPRLPSYSFIHAYFAAFRPRAPPILPEIASQGDKTLLLAFEALEAQSYIHSFTLVQEAIEQDISWDAGKAEAFNLRGTFKFLLGDSQGSRKDLLEAIELQPSLTQAWVKMASVLMELGDPEATFSAFDEAIKHNPQDPDIYYHRGQVNFIMQKYREAEADYTQSMKIDDKFVFSHIQLAVAQYKTEQVAAAMATFRRTMKAFPNMSEPLNYYGELLLDQQRFPDAVEKFDRAIEIERSKKPMNVLPLVNKALTIFQWQQDIIAAENLLKEAIEIDSDNESAIATLAQLTLQQGRLDDAVELFDKHAKIARTEAELEQALTFKYATSAQLGFLKQFPHMAAQLGQLARQMQGQ